MLTVPRTSLCKGVRSQLRAQPSTAVQRHKAPTTHSATNEALVALAAIAGLLAERPYALSNSSPAAQQQQLQAVTAYPAAAHAVQYPAPVKAPGLFSKGRRQRKVAAPAAC